MQRASHKELAELLRIESLCAWRVIGALRLEAQCSALWRVPSVASSAGSTAVDPPQSHRHVVPAAALVAVACCMLNVCMPHRSHMCACVPAPFAPVTLQAHTALPPSARQSRSACWLVMCQAGHAISSLGSSLMASRAKADAEALLAEIRVIDGAQAAAPAIHYNVVRSKLPHCLWTD
jgi:hypothetical protein